MASTVTVCLPGKRLHVQVRVHEAGVGAGAGASASASCQGLMLLLPLPPPPENGSVLLVPGPPPHPCPPAHLLRTCPLQNQSLTQVSNHPPKPARELKPGPPATLVRCTHTSLSLLSIISITINRSAPLTCTPSHRITAHTHAIESMLMLILGCHTTDLQVFSCPRTCHSPTLFLRLVVAVAASGQDSQKARLRRPSSSLCFEFTLPPAHCSCDPSVAASH